MTRDAQITAFLDAAGRGDATQVKLPGDASLRRYSRLCQGTTTAMLMDAPPATGEDTGPFIAIARHLVAHGFSAPRILAEDRATGLLLIEDFGDGLVARLADRNSTTEIALYRAAGTTLGALQSLPLPQNLPDYVPQMANLAALSLDWYAPECADLRGDLVAAIEDLLPLALRKTAVFVHRDFHGENLIWLPERTETKQIGLLDFQDAMSGPAEYDIGSLIHDPRRTVSDGAKAAAWQAYLDRAGHCETDARLGLAICSAQRSLRILGVFARLCMRDGKAHYPDFIPRTWQALQRDLSHPALARLAGVLTTLPAPTDDRLAAIKSQAGQLRGHSQARVWA